jgi:hypothetical protein
MWMLRSVTICAVLALAVAACSGDDGGSDEPGGGSTGATSGDTGADTGSAPGVFDSAQCADAVAAWSSASSAATEALTGSSGDLNDTLAQLQAFAEAAPEEIRDDLTTVYDAYGQFLQAMEDSGYDPNSGDMPTADQLAAITTAGEALSAPEVAAASENVSNWFSENCGAA